MDKPAIEGGRPVREKFLPYGKQWITDEDIEEVNKVLRSDWLTTGPMVRTFEEEFAKYVGAKHAVSASSGTSALYIATSAMGLGKGDTAITRCPN